MNAAVTHLRKNVVAYVALFVALGGTSYAAVSLPAGSVGNRQLKNHSISPIKFERGSIAGYVRDWAEIDPNGQLVASRPSAHLVGWGETGAFPGGIVSWGQAIPQVVHRYSEHRRPPAACFRWRNDHQWLNARAVRGSKSSAFRADRSHCGRDLPAAVTVTARRR